jgi:hypothetical protein
MKSRPLFSARIGTQTEQGEVRVDILASASGMTCSVYKEVPPIVALRAIYTALAETFETQSKPIPYTLNIRCEPSRILPDDTMGIILQVNDLLPVDTTHSLHLENGKVVYKIAYDIRQVDHENTLLITLGACYIGQMVIGSIIANQGQ